MRGRGRGRERGGEREREKERERVLGASGQAIQKCSTARSAACALGLHGASVHHSHACLHREHPASAGAQVMEGWSAKERQRVERNLAVFKQAQEQEEQRRAKKAKGNR